MNNNSLSDDAVRATERDATAWVVRLDSRQVTVDEAQAFKDWCAQSRQHAAAFAEARAVWLALQPAARRVAHKEAESSRRVVSSPVPARFLDRRTFLRGALAASIGYFALRPPLQLWPSLIELAADYRTATGEQREVVLADGAVIQMNTQTRINVAAGEGGGGIELLAGELEVVPGFRRLNVVAAGGMISAADARFNISHLDAEVCVTCLAGRVDVALGSQRVVLDAGGQLTYGAQGLRTPTAVNPTQLPAWRQRLLVFNQTPLAAVVAEVNRYRPGKLVLATVSLGRNQVQASISLDRLDDVIALIRDVYGAEATHLPGGVIVFV